MDYIYAFLAGYLGKLYDDLNDNKLISKNLSEILKGCQWMLLTLLSYNDFNFALVNYIMNAANAYTNWEAYSEPYEKALLILAPFLIFISYSTCTIPTISDLVFIVCSILALAIEPLIIKEEFSIRKLIMRIYLFISSFFVIIVGIYFGVRPSYIKIPFYGLGYFLVSSCFQTCLNLHSMLNLSTNIIIPAITTEGIC